MFHSANLPITRNSTSSLNTLYTAKNAQCYSDFLPTTISWTRCCHRKCEVSLRFIAKNAQYKPKMRSYEDNPSCSYAFFVTWLCYALSAKTGNDKKLQKSVRIWERFSKMLAILCLASIDDWMMQTGLKTDYENFVHEYFKASSFWHDRANYFNAQNCAIQTVSLLPSKSSGVTLN